MDAFHPCSVVADTVAELLFVSSFRSSSTSSFVRRLDRRSPVRARLCNDAIMRAECRAWEKMSGRNTGQIGYYIYNNEEIRFGTLRSLKLNRID